MYFEERDLILNRIIMCDAPVFINTSLFFFASFYLCVFLHMDRTISVHSQNIYFELILRKF